MNTKQIKTDAIAQFNEKFGTVGTPGRTQASLDVKVQTPAGVVNAWVSGTYKGQTVRFDLNGKTSSAAKVDAAIEAAEAEAQEIDWDKVPVTITTEEAAAAVKSAPAGEYDTFAKAKWAVAKPAGADDFVYEPGKGITPAGMTLEQIKAAVDSGKVVHWMNEAYTVKKDRLGWYYIAFLDKNAIGLTHTDGETMNGKPEQFYMPAPALSSPPAPHYTVKALERMAATLNDSHARTGAGFYVDFASGGCVRCYLARVEFNTLQVKEIRSGEVWHVIDPSTDTVRDGHGTRPIILK